MPFAATASRGGAVKLQVQECSLPHDGHGQALHGVLKQRPEQQVTARRLDVSSPQPLHCATGL